MFCVHDWKLLSDVTTKSKFRDSMETLDNGSTLKLPWQLCDAKRKHIQVFSCIKCGKLKRFVEDI